MLKYALMAAIAVPLSIQQATAQETTAPETTEPETTAQETTTQETAAPETTTQETSDVIVEDQASSEVRGDWLLGARVRSPEGESIGSIEDLILDQESGTVTAAVVSVGGFLGMGAKRIAVDWQELDIDYDGNEITLGITREEAEAAPEYTFRDRQSPPAAQPDTGTDTGMGTGGTGTGGVGTGTGGTGTGGLD